MTDHFNNDAIQRYEYSSKWKLLKNFDASAPNHDTVPFTVAEMEWKTPPCIVEGLKKYLDSAVLGYTEPCPRYYEALNSWFGNYYNFQISPEEIFITPGVISALRTSIYAFSKEDDGIVLLTPSYNTFFKTINQTKRKIVAVELANNQGQYTIDFSKLEEAFSDPTNTLFILCSPHNPIGRVWTKDELLSISQLAHKHNVLVLADEIHADLIMPGETFTSYVTIDPMSPAFFSVTKTFNLAGLKVSHMVVKNSDMREKLSKVFEAYGSNGANALGINAVGIAYTLGRPWLEEAISKIYDNYNLIKTSLDKRYIVSKLEGTYLLWIDCRAVEGLYSKLADYHIHVGDGEWYGENGRGFIRVNIACPQPYIQHLIDTLNSL